MTQSKGSLSVEGVVVAGVLLCVFSLFFSFLYSNLVMERVYESFTLWVLENNVEELSPVEFEHIYVEVKNDKFQVFHRWESPIPVFTSYSHLSDFVVYVSDTGSKYHRKSCPYVAISKKTMKIKEAKEKYSPCSKCFP